MSSILVISQVNLIFAHPAFLSLVKCSATVCSCNQRRIAAQDKCVSADLQSQKATYVPMRVIWSHSHTQNPIIIACFFLSDELRYVIIIILLQILEQSFALPAEDKTHHTNSRCLIIFSHFNTTEVVLDACAFGYWKNMNEAVRKSSMNSMK